MSDHDDNDLFRSAVGQVRRVRSQRDRSRPAAPEAEARQRRRDEDAVMQELSTGPVDWSAVETGEEISHHKPGVQRRVLGRLRRGHWRIEDEIDLHQMNLEAARNTIREFLQQAWRERLSCIKIIHGKGLRSGPSGPQLKRLTASLLARDRRVAAFMSAPPHDGGTGAVYVLLQARR